MINLLFSLIMYLVNLFVTTCLLLQKQCRKHVFKAAINKYRYSINQHYICKLSCYELTDRHTEFTYITYMWGSLRLSPTRFVLMLSNKYLLSFLGGSHWQNCSFPESTSEHLSYSGITGYLHGNHVAGTMKYCIHSRKMSTRDYQW